MDINAINYIGPDIQIGKIVQHNTMNIFINPSALTFVWGAQKNHLIEIVLLSIHNIYFG